MIDVTLKIVKETSVVGEESYYLEFGNSYISGSFCPTLEKANELFESFKNKVQTPIKTIVRSEIIQISKKE